MFRNCTYYNEDSYSSKLSYCINDAEDKDHFSVTVLTVKIPPGVVNHCTHSVQVTSGVVNHGTYSVQVTSGVVNHCTHSVQVT